MGAERLPSKPVLAVTALTIAAFVVRLVGFDQSIFGDEVLLLDRVRDRSLGDMFTQVHDLESTPPFHFLLAWAAVEIGGADTWIRLPSLVLGTATVPLTYLLGVRTVGPRAALVGAAVVALAPFAIFYGTEGRAYATLGFLAALSTLGLIRALDTNRPAWWIVYSAASCLVMYTHYTGVFLLTGQAVWALWSHRDRWRPLLLAGGAAVLAFLPWLPSLVFQSDDNASNRIASLSPLSVKSFLTDVLKFLTGHPFVPLRDLPGRAALILFCVVAGAAAAIALVRLARRGTTPRDGVWLLTAAALASPVGLLLYSLVAKSIVLPRNMSASLAAAALLVGWALTSLGRVPSLVATCLAMAALGVGTIKALDSDYQRPPFADAAGFIEARSSGADSVVDFFYESSENATGRELVLNFDQQHRVFRAGRDDLGAWRRARRLNAQVFLVVPQIGALRGVPQRSGPGGRFRLRAHAIYPGWIPIGVFEYELPTARANLPVSPERTRPARS